MTCDYVKQGDSGIAVKSCFNSGILILFFFLPELVGFFLEKKDLILVKLFRLVSSRLVRYLFFSLLLAFDRS